MLFSSGSFHGMPSQLKYTLEVKPESRVRELPGVEHPLGGFIPTFEALCDFHSIPRSGDIIWDMENLYSLGDIKDLNLNGNMSLHDPKKLWIYTSFFVLFFLTLIFSF